MTFMFGLQHPLTCKPWTTLSNPCNKVWGKYVVKEVFLRPLFMCLSFIMRLLSLRRYVSSIYICIFRHESADEYTTTSLGEGELWILTSFILPKNWPCVISCPLCFRVRNLGLPLWSLLSTISFPTSLLCKCNNRSLEERGGQHNNKIR